MFSYYCLIKNYTVFLEIFAAEFLVCSGYHGRFWIPHRTSSGAICVPQVESLRILMRGFLAIGLELPRESLSSPCIQPAPHYHFAWEFWELHLMR